MPRRLALGVLLGLAASLAFCPRPVAAQIFSDDLDVPFIQTRRNAADVSLKPAQLHRKGMAGLVELFDEILPETAGPKKLTVPAGDVERLIAQLGDDSYRVRETATEKLAALGSGVRPFLMKAAKDPNAEISWRAVRVLRGLEGRKYDDKSQYLSLLSAYCAGIHDDERLAEIARRTSLAIDAGIWGDSRTEILRQCLMTLVRANKPQYVELLKKYLKHPNAQVALLVTEAAGQATGWSNENSTPPTVLMAAMLCGREEVVGSALQFVEGVTQKQYRTEIKQTLLALFGGKNENLKFQAALPLMRQFKYPEAADYVLEQAKGTDMARRYNALSALTAEPPRKSSPSKKFAETIFPLLKNDDPNTRHMASMAVSSYAGEDVIRALLPLLCDKENFVSNQVTGRLLEQPDKKLLRRILQETAEKDKDRKLQRQARSALDSLNELEGLDRPEKQRPAKSEAEPLADPTATVPALPAAKH